MVDDEDKPQGKMSDKEKCFQAAWEAVKGVTDVGGMKVAPQRAWGLESGGWVSGYGNWWQAIRSLMGKVAKQVRRPDLTITENGNTSVVDLKFTRADKTPDKWGTKVGANGNTQLDDYNDINTQENGGKDPYGGKPELSAKSCGCGEGTKVEALVVAPDESYAKDKLLFQGMDPRTVEAMQQGLAAAGRGLQGLGELLGGMGGRGVMEGEPIFELP
ncbi:hypothetical protein Bsp3421_002023 [Burkholderia sp. FERM BP-3421]|uniref:hypothetical protein n=1 Tax=Burkholderia sp. FERM BP-3421 TaxID=1494466 RepID=UPI00235EE05F|nr:hypothetical protein [Burkholderia sp. FERM BP-3421]WDD92052.1 hypothetical protein Bsp3421_002023 [Burkholderia sp. FERM BP-3421]